MKSNEELHRELWFWLAENPEKEKYDWPEFNVLENITNHCFACVACETCQECPIDWETNNGLCDNSGLESIYNIWEFEPDLEKKSIMAEVIACKEWKK